MRHGLKPVYVGSYCPDSAFLDGDLDVIRVVEVVTTNPTPSERPSSLIKGPSSLIAGRVEATQVPVRKESKWKVPMPAEVSSQIHRAGEYRRRSADRSTWSLLDDIQDGSPARKRQAWVHLAQGGRAGVPLPDRGKATRKGGSTGLTNMPKGRTCPRPERIQAKDVPKY